MYIASFPEESYLEFIMVQGNNPWLDDYWDDVATEQITGATTKLLGYCEIRTDLFPDYAVIRHQGKTFVPIRLITNSMKTVNVEIVLRTKDSGFHKPIAPATLGSILKGELVIWLEKDSSISKTPSIMFYGNDYIPEQFK